MAEPPAPCAIIPVSPFPEVCGAVGTSEVLAGEIRVKPPKRCWEGGIPSLGGVTGVVTHCTGVTDSGSTGGKFLAALCWGSFGDENHGEPSMECSWQRPHPQGCAGARFGIAPGCQGSPAGLSRSAGIQVTSTRRCWHRDIPIPVLSSSPSLECW